MSYPLHVRVDGVDHVTTVDAAGTLLDVVRRNLGVTGPKEGCDDSECGACMVLLDGTPANSCCVLALQAEGRDVTTVAGATEGRIGRAVADRLLDEGGVQCGFCTPGIVISATALLAATPNPTSHDVRTALSGNLCRCTGYQKIVAAVHRAAEDLADPPA